MSALAIVARWPDGVETSAPSAGDLLDAIAAVQWDAPLDRAAIKAVLSDRAWAWSRTAIDPLASDARFVAECARAGLFDLAYRRLDPGPGPE